MTEQLTEYPTERVVGMALEPEVVGRARSAVGDLGVAGVSVELIEPDQHDEATTDTEDTGESLMARVRKTFGEEAPHLERLSTALEQGNTIVLVSLPDRDEDEEAHDAAKRQVGDALIDVGVKEVTYYGKYTVEDLGIAGT